MGPVFGGVKCRTGRGIEVRARCYADVTPHEPMDWAAGVGWVGGERGFERTKRVVDVICVVG